MFPINIEQNDVNSMEIELNDFLKLLENFEVTRSEYENLCAKEFVPSGSQRS